VRRRNQKRSSQTPYSRPSFAPRKFESPEILPAADEPRTAPDAAVAPTGTWSLKALAATPLRAAAWLGTRVRRVNIKGWEIPGHGREGASNCSSLRKSVACGCDRFLFGARARLRNKTQGLATKAVAPHSLKVVIVTVSLFVWRYLFQLRVLLVLKHMLCGNRCSAFWRWGGARSKPRIGRRTSVGGALVQRLSSERRRSWGGTAGHRGRSCRPSPITYSRALWRSSTGPKHKHGQRSKSPAAARGSPSRAVLSAA
jgi:hypothetical protein